MSDSYLTVRQKISAEFTEKRSRFIGSVCPVSTEDEALDFIAQTKKKYSDARHNAYAYIVRSNNTIRYSDDGEPQGTAGMPALDVLRKEGLTDVAVVVTRYFGGILLGGGGLVRAYSRSVKEAVDASGILRMEMRKIFSVQVAYPLYASVQKCIEDCGGVIAKSKFLEKITIEYSMAEKDTAEFERKLADASNGSVAAVQTGEEYVGLEE